MRVPIEVFLVVTIGKVDRSVKNNKHFGSKNVTIIERKQGIGKNLKKEVSVI